MTKDYKSTMVELVEELEKLENPHPLVAEIILEAKAGEYHDYKNKKYDCGKVALVEHLRSAHLDSLAHRVIEGEFDEKADAEDIEMMRGDLIADYQAGRATKDQTNKMLKIFGLGEPI